MRSDHTRSSTKVVGSLAKVVGTQAELGQGMAVSTEAALGKVVVNIRAVAGIELATGIGLDHQFSSDQRCNWGPFQPWLFLII